MKSKKRFIAMDVVYVLMMILPIAAAITIKVLTTPQSDGINITGARIFFDIPFPIQNLIITESQINTWLVMISILGLCLFLTHGLTTKKPRTRQLIAEWIVQQVEKLTKSGMGDYFMGYTAFVGAILALSGFSSLLSLFGLYPPTSDLNVVAGWALLVFILITYYKFKCGPLQYIKSFGDPVPLLSPLNIISEVATPVSMAFRHYGNVLSGSVIAVLVASGLAGLSSKVLGWLPGVLGDIPFLRIGIPAILSIYFDIFSGCLQAYIFAMLTMMYVSSAFPMEKYFKKKAKKNKSSEVKTKC